MFVCDVVDGDLHHLEKILPIAPWKLLDLRRSSSLISCRFLITFQVFYDTQKTFVSGRKELSF